MCIIGIYKIQSIIHPERCYIGSAVNIKHRWQLHLSDLKLNKHHSRQLQRHYNKYGLQDLQFSIILNDCKKEDLLFLEQIFITPLPYFNCCPTAGSQLGNKHTEEQNKRQSEKMKGRIPWNKGKSGIYSKETIEQNRQAHLNKPSGVKGKHWKLSEESKNNIRIGLIGINIWSKGNRNASGKRSEETKANMRKSHGAMSEENKEIHRQAALRIGIKPPSRKGIPSPKRGKHYIKTAINTN